jgi:CRP-like cAMP-binding protein
MRRRQDGGLRRLDAFRGCSDHELSRVLSLADRIPVAPGHVIVRWGERTREFYILLEGKASVTRGDRLLDVIGPGDYCGELALLDPAPRNATVTMVTDGALLAFGQREFMTLLEELPQLCRRLLRGLAHRVHDLDAQQV